MDTQTKARYSSMSWGMLPNISKVLAELNSSEEAFIDAISVLISKYQQSDRLALTILHSHFDVYEGEALVERYDPRRKLVHTAAYKDEALRNFDNLAMKSWKFSVKPVDGLNIVPLTWVRKADIPQNALGDGDTTMLAELAGSFRKHGMTERFGMALIGHLPDKGKIWSEGEDTNDRYLVQEQLDEAEVRARESIMTMWIFPKDGSARRTMGCCFKSKDGHTGTIHPWS